MNLIPQMLNKDEQVNLMLEGLFESYGYRKFKMRKFEQYSLYEEFRSFLISEYVLTFHSPVPMRKQPTRSSIGKTFTEWIAIPKSSVRSRKQVWS